MTNDSTRSAWYIGARQPEIGEAAILVGDRGRIDRIARVLERPMILPERRGLRTVTGRWQGRRITATAFGMGAPIAVIVMRELAALGIRTFLRIGTAMVIAPAALGDLLVADSAIALDGISRTLRPDGGPVEADAGLAADIVAAAPAGRPLRRGLFASQDVFYGAMFPLEQEERPAVEAERSRLASLGVLATDMETGALLTVGPLHGLAVGSLCLGTVDAATQEKLDEEQLAAGEAALFETSLDGLARTLERTDGDGR